TNIKSFEGIPLRDYFTTFSFAEGKKFRLMNAMEILLGLQIEHYIAFDVDTYAENFSKLGFSFDSLRGKYINTDLVKNNAISEQDAVTINQQEFIASFFQQLSLFQYYKLFLHSLHIQEAFQTSIESH